MNIDICERCKNRINHVTFHYCPVNKKHDVLYHCKEECDLVNDKGEILGKFNFIDCCASILIPPHLMRKVDLLLEPRGEEDKLADWQHFKEKVYPLVKHLMVKRYCKYYAEHLICDWNKDKQ